MIVLVSFGWGFAPVIEKLPGGEIDWTAEELRAGASGTPTGGMVVVYESLEQDARSRLGLLMLELARRLQVTPTETAGDFLKADDVVADHMDGYLSGWGIEESRYYTSGRVELDGFLSLPTFVRPALVGKAEGREREGPPTIPVTGMVVDARGLRVSPSVAPVLSAADGARIYDIRTLTRDAASQRTPCVWVTDPADPVGVKRAGDQPLFVRATAVHEGALVIGDTAVAAIQAAAAGAPFLIHGQVVIVVDP